MNRESYINTIMTFLSSFEDEVVREALKRRALGEKSNRNDDGWKLTDAKLPFGLDNTKYDLMQLRGRWYIRPKRVIEVPSVAESAPKRKTDLSPQRSDKKCIYCGEEMIYEPICPGCREGKMGFVGKYICMDNLDHVLYVRKEE